MEITQELLTKISNFIEFTLEQRGIFGNYFIHSDYDDETPTIIVEEKITPQDCKEHKQCGLIREQVQIFEEERFDDFIIINLHIIQYKTIWLENLNELSQIVCKLIKKFAEKELSK